MPRVERAHKMVMPADNNCPPINLRRRFIIALLVGASCSIGYLGINALTSTFVPHDVMSEWDRSIPFVAEWVWVYSLNIPMPLALVFLVRRDEDLLEIIGGFLTVFLIGATVFFVYPVSAAELRAPVDDATLSRAFVGFYYWMDGHANCLPSMHVAYSLYAGFWGFARFERPWRAIYLAVGVAISVSTVLVKQHYVIDVLAGAALGGGIAALQLSGKGCFSRWLPAGLTAFISACSSETEQRSSSSS